MQQLTENHINEIKLIGLIHADNNPAIVICQFEFFPTWDQAENQCSDWLKAHQFKLIEIITGGDRLTWRVELSGQRFYFHYEDLSESAWFEHDNVELENSFLTDLKSVLLQV